MTIKEQIIQELERIPESRLEKVLSFLEQMSDSAQLSRAEEIIHRGLNIAMSKTQRPPSEIWTEFEAVRTRISESVANEQSS